MMYKFKIGDEVQIKRISELYNYTWFHLMPMKIIATNEFYYFTDYWHNDVLNFNNQFDGITEECLEYTNNYLRKMKLVRIIK